MKYVVIAALLAVVGISSGCLWAPNLAVVRKDIERQLPGARFDKEIELSLGPLSLTFARLVTRMVPEANDAHRYLSNVSRIELAVYNVDELPSTSAMVTPARLSRLQEDEGWEMAVKVCDNNERVWVLYRIDDDSIKELYVVVLGDEELVMVKAKGRLERLAAHALSESGAMPGLPEHGEL
jgi:hypothetical protein